MVRLILRDTYDMWFDSYLIQLHGIVWIVFRICNIHYCISIDVSFSMHLELDNKYLYPSSHKCDFISGKNSESYIILPVIWTYNTYNRECLVLV